MSRAKTIASAGEQLSFLPPAPFCPAWPTKHTLEDKALALLIAGRAIDHPEFEGDCGSWVSAQRTQVDQNPAAVVGS